MVASVKPGVRTPILRSLRFKVLLVTASLLVAPLAFAFAWGLAERRVEGSTRSAAVESANEAIAAIAASRETSGSTEADVRAIAQKHGVRIRWVTQASHERVDADHQRQTDFLHDLSERLLGDDRSLSVHAFDESLGGVAYRPETLRALQGEAVIGCRTSVGSKLLVCHAVRPLPGGGFVYVQQTSRRALRALYDSRFQLIRLVLLLLPVGLGFAWWMAGRIVRPLEALQEEAMRKAASPRPEGTLAPQGMDEVGDLSRAFNSLLAKLDDRRRDNERFVADLVHEFKTPVSTVSACSETLASGGVDEARAARLSRMLRDASTRLDALVSQFLELARAEAGMPGEKRALFDLSALARGVVAAQSPHHPHLAFDVSCAGSPHPHGVEVRVESLLRNLLDNAASFAVQRVTVRVSVEGKEAVVEVVDDGPGVAPGDLARVFDRFFTTRERNKGSGLGLALVRAVAEAHGGAVVVSSVPGQGATFEVRLPLDG